MCGSGSVGRALPCQGKGRGFEPRLPLQLPCFLAGFFIEKPLFQKTENRSAFFLPVLIRLSVLSVLLAPCGMTG